VVIHVGPDDDRTDPSGNSGGRIACGVITAGPPGERPRGYRRPLSSASSSAKPAMILAARRVNLPPRS